MSKSKPVGGYGFQAKNSYRRQLWDFVKNNIAVKPSAATVVVLETSDGYEVRELLRRGFAPTQIHAVNRNPAEIAQLTRRLEMDGLPRVVTHGTDFLAALKRIGTADVVNFDACASIGWGCANYHEAHRDPTVMWGSYLYHVAEHVRAGGVLAHTMLIGRERGEYAEHMRESNGFLIRDDRGRLIPASYLTRLSFALVYATAGYYKCRRHVTRLAYDWYRSSAGNQRMLWFAAKVQPHVVGVSLDACLNLTRRLYGANADRMLVLMMPRCLRSAMPEEQHPLAPDDNLLFIGGRMRFGKSHYPSEGAAGTPDADDVFTPWATGFGRPQPTMRV
jgi:hypothetical protein